MGLLFETIVRGIYKLFGLDSPFQAEVYGPNWSKQRQKCLERDDYQCRVCGLGIDDLDSEPSVHHIAPRRQHDGNWRQNRLENLITLCPSCHGCFEGRFQDATPEEFATRAEREL